MLSREMTVACSGVGLGFRVSNLRSGVWGLGLRVSGLGNVCCLLTHVRHPQRAEEVLEAFCVDQLYLQVMVGVNVT